MTSGGVHRGPESVTTAWLSAVLDREVRSVAVSQERADWSSLYPIDVGLADGSSCQLRLKVCRGETFGRSEVDYYTRDYVDMVDAPLVRCWHAQFEAGDGYHLLLDDLSHTHHNRRDVTPTLDYGLAVAEALGRLHRHHWGAQSAPTRASIDRYFAEINPGIAAFEAATGRSIRGQVERHERVMRERWARPHGMTLLHGDLNPMNILTPKTSDAPVYFLDRQPFVWSLRYGIAVLDLAYCVAVWWPSDVAAAHQEVILRRWYDSIAVESYSWREARADWDLCVEQCLHVPLEWCSKPETVEKMRWLWTIQLERIERAMSRTG